MRHESTHIRYDPMLENKNQIQDAVKKLEVVSGRNMKFRRNESES